MKKRIRLTWHDIKSADCGEPQTCAVAKALNRCCKQKGWTVVDPDDIHSPYKVAYQVVKKDALKVSNFIIDFDNKRKVRPIAFDIVPYVGIN